MNKIILPVLSLIFCINISAQLPKSLIKPLENSSVFEEYDGSIYSTFSYKNSSLIDEKSGTFNAKLRYNIYADAIEFKSGDKEYEVLKRPNMHAMIDDNYFYYCQFKTPRGVDVEGYFILVEMTDKYRIYKKHTLEIKDPEKDPITLLTKPGVLKVATTYYLEESGKIIDLPDSKKSMLAAFSDKADELKKYMKSKRIKLRKEDDLKRLVAKYNALKSIDNESSSYSLLINN